MRHTLFPVIVNHCLLKLTMYFPVSQVLFLFMFCTSMNVFWLLVVSSGRAWPFSADSLHFWNLSCFHATVCWQSQSLCLLEEWCKAHLLAQAGRKKAAFKEGLWVACFFQRLQCPCLTSESPEAIWVVISYWQQLSAVLLWLFSPCIQAFRSRFCTQRYFKESSVTTLVLDISVTLVPSRFRLVNFLQIFFLFL